MQSFMRSQPQFCVHCGNFIHNVGQGQRGGCRKRKSLLPYCVDTFDLSEDGEVVFCTQDCFNHYDQAQKMAALEPPKVRKTLEYLLFF